jgi:predicted metal-binding protein
MDRPQKIIVAQWVRMKCMFGCVEYGRSGACPPNTPSVTDYEQKMDRYAFLMVH